MRRDLAWFDAESDANEFYSRLRDNPVRYSVDKPIQQGPRWMVAYTQWSVE